MGWNIFKDTYKRSWETFESGEDAANLIADQYHLAVMTASPPGGSMGAAVGGMYASGNKAGLASALKLAFNATINGVAPVFKIGQQLKLGLLTYWVPGTPLTNGALIMVNAGVPLWIDYPFSYPRDSLDKFLGDLVQAFNTHMIGLSGMIPGTVPVPFVGYKVIDDSSPTEEEMAELALQQAVEDDWYTIIQSMTEEERAAAFEGRQWVQSGMYDEGYDASAHTDYDEYNSELKNAFDMGINYELG